MNKPLHWLYRQSGQRIASGVQSCYLCGHDCADSHLVGKAIADTFNSHYLAQCRSSAYLCDACAWYFDSKAGHEDYRKMSLVVTEHSWRNWQRIDMKQDIARWLEHGMDVSAYLVVSLSKKKHILLQAPLNAQGATTLAIQVEEQVAHVDFATWQAIEHPFMGLLALGHNKGEILSGDLYANTLRKHGRMIDAVRWSRQLDEWRNSPLIELYSYTTIIEEKGENTGDGTGRRRDNDTAESGDAANGDSIATADGHMEEHRPGIQETLPARDLASVRGTHRHSRADDRDATGVPQPSLWDA